MVTRALIREMRRLGALSDVEILKRLRPDKEMESLAGWASQVTEDID
jgi:hypothetical protein